MKPAIEIINLGKQYKLTNSAPYIALRDVISESARNIFSGKKKKQDSFWALRDINLSIEPGERVGIIGRNGAGKSTLLKIISRITPPTTGEAIIRGRVGSLLEVGTGFHPELSGRENIYLNGSILGLKRAEITKQLDAIIDFSGVEKFIDTPLKHYSSGMQLRLAFSVAAHLEPEILLIDEVLAVGDMEFQKKCLGKMEEVSKKDGRTILFVSHDLNAVSRLTQKCILLDKGNLILYGATDEAITIYNNQNSERKIDYQKGANTSKPSITKIKMITSDLNKTHTYGKELIIEFEIDIPIKIDRMALSFQIMNFQDQPIIHNWILESSNNTILDEGRFSIKCIIPTLRIYMGRYTLNAYLGEDKGKEVFDFIQNAVPFEITMADIDPGHSFGWQINSCIYREDHKWEIQKI